MKALKTSSFKNIMKVPVCFLSLFPLDHARFQDIQVGIVINTQEKLLTSAVEDWEHFTIEASQKKKKVPVVIVFIFYLKKVLLIYFSSSRPFLQQSPFCMFALKYWGVINVSP